MVELADKTNLKFVDGNIVRVRSPLPIPAALGKRHPFFAFGCKYNRPQSGKGRICFPTNVPG